MKFLFIFSIFLFTFLFFTSRYKNLYKLYLIFGKKGSGKSTYLIKLAYTYLEKGWIVYTNMADCCLPGVRYFDVSKLGEFVPEQNSLLLIDEVGMIWDNRDFKNFKPSLRDFFKLQRHYHVLVYLASQTFDVDKKIRDLTDGMILFSNVFNVFSIGRPITRRVVLTEAQGDSESRISENLRFLPFWNWKIVYLPRWSEYFNSFVAPDLPKLPYREIPSHNLDDVITITKNKPIFTQYHLSRKFRHRYRKLKKTFRLKKRSN